MRLLLLHLTMILFIAGTVHTTAGEDKKEKVQYKSVITQNSAPRPFTAVGDNPKTQPSISTGYYIVDSEDNSADYNPTTRSGWRPSPETVSLNFEPALWNQITSGPYQLPASYWETNTTEGLRYFRNPANMNDSTDNAFAGPIPLRLSQPFYFNGVRYDSFYVSTNGIIALSNRRYFYNPATGERYIPDGATSAYDPNSDDTRARDNSSPQASLTDPTPDNYGYRYIALGMTNETTSETATATSLQGIRNPDNATLANFTNNAPIIAPFWDDLQLSQFNRYTNQVDEDGKGFGRVWYKRSATGDRLVIYFINLMPINGKNTPFGNANFLRDVRPGMGDNFVSVNAQVVLNASDSSVHFNYEVFDGIASVGGRPVPSNTVFRYNSTIGLRGQARHVNYGPPAGGETRYNQFTEYLMNNTVYVNAPPVANIPNNGLAIRFKQWKNVLRSYGTKYVLRNPATNQFDASNRNYVVTDPNNFELLAGDPLLGAIQPIAMFQNLSNNIQGPNGVNFQQQNLNFRVRFRIRNDILNEIVYNRLICPDSAMLHDGSRDWERLTFGARLVDAAGNPIEFPGPNNLNGIPPYGFVEVKFPAFESSNLQAAQIGRLTSEIIAEPFSCAGGGSYGDQWPFDDTTRIRLFSVRRLTSFNDDASDYSSSRFEGPLPSVNKWVSINAEVMSGDDATYNPPPPRGRRGQGNDRLSSPVICLNRVMLGGANPNPLPGGDELRSFPIDLRNKKGAVISFSYQRTGIPPGRDAGYNRGWRDQTLVGPEPRVVQNAAPPYADEPVTNIAQQPDELYLEFASPSPDGYKNIVNIPAAEWSKHPRMDNPGQFFNSNPAISIFGGGGYRRGWHEENGDSAISRADGLRANLYDDGKDFEFKKMFIQIPDTMINAPNEGAKNFRFRFRVNATDHTTLANADDEDNFFVDNVRIFFPTESPDLEISSVQVKWPYTVAPSSQSSEMPVGVTVSNNTSIGASSFAVQVLIKRRLDPENRYVYCRSMTIPFLPANREVELNMPTWNGRQTTPGEYILAGRLYTPWGDPNRLNDSTHGEFTLNFGPAYAYDPVTPTGQNDVPQPQFSGQVGKGLNLGGSAVGSDDWRNFAYGGDAGNSSGQMAMKFRITTQDTIYGYQAYFGSLNSDLLNIRFSLYRDAGGAPGQRITTSLVKQRGYDDIRSPLQNPPEPFYNEYTTYTTAPVVLLPGTYWMSVAQMGLEGFELGGSSFRMGQVTTYAGSIIRTGDANISLNAFKGFRRKNIAGDLINDNTFAYENSLGSGTWQPFTPTVGNPGYAHLNSVGFIGQRNTYSRGSWIPMIRPYFGERKYSDPPIYLDSALCAAIVPVELANFDGVVRRGGIDLFWETATEINNAGFHVERRVADADQSWEALTFVGGQGNSTVLNRYGYLDKKVVRGTTYEYRLRQVDFDGSETYSNTIERTYNYAENVVLEQNYPNPFSDKTSINYAVPDGGYLKLEITDMMGNVVVSIANGYVDAGNHTYEWNGLDASGNRVTAGTYLCKLTQGDQVIVRKMSIIR